MTGRVQLVTMSSGVGIGAPEGLRDLEWTASGLEWTAGRGGASRPPM